MDEYLKQLLAERTALNSRIDWAIQEKNNPFAHGHGEERLKDFQAEREAVEKKINALITPSP